MLSKCESCEALGGFRSEYIFLCYKSNYNMENKVIFSRNPNVEMFSGLKFSFTNFVERRVENKE